MTHSIHLRHMWFLEKMYLIMLLFDVNIYIEVLRNEITNSSTYQATTSTETQIIDDHVIATAQLKATSDRLKTFYVLAS